MHILTLLFYKRAESTRKDLKRGDKKKKIKTSSRSSCSLVTSSDQSDERGNTN